MTSSEAEAARAALARELGVDTLPVRSSLDDEIPVEEKAERKKRDGKER